MNYLRRREGGEAAAPPAGLCFTSVWFLKFYNFVKIYCSLSLLVSLSCLLCITPNAARLSEFT